MGLPGETKETIERTMKFAEDLDCETIQVSIAHAYPGTELYDFAVQNGFMDDVAVDRIKEFQAKLTEFLTSRKAELMGRIFKEKALNDALTADLKAAVSEFKPSFK